SGSAIEPPSRRMKRVWKCCAAGRLRTGSYAIGLILALARCGLLVEPLLQPSPRDLVIIRAAFIRQLLKAINGFLIRADGERAGHSGPAPQWAQLDVLPREG